MDKGIIAYFIYEIFYWVIWLAFIYMIVRLSDSFGYLWILIIPCLMNTTYSRKVTVKDKEEEVNAGD